MVRVTIHKMYIIDARSVIRSSVHNLTQSVYLIYSGSLQEGRQIPRCRSYTILDPKVPINLRFLGLDHGSLQPVLESRQTGVSEGRDVRSGPCTSLRRLEET